MGEGAAGEARHVGETRHLQVGGAPGTSLRVGQRALHIFAPRSAGWPYFVVSLCALERGGFISMHTRGGWLLRGFSTETECRRRSRDGQSSGGGKGKREEWKRG